MTEHLGSVNFNNSPVNINSLPNTSKLADVPFAGAFITGMQQSLKNEEALKKETSQRYLKHWLSGLGYLALGEIEWVKRLPAGL